MTTFHPVFANDFSTMDDDALAAAVSTLAAHIHAATYRLLVLIAELEVWAAQGALSCAGEVWAAQGALSCAHWLSWACGIDTHTAAGEGPRRPCTDRAADGTTLRRPGAGQGRPGLGYSKVRALTRIATPENEDDLLNIGLHGTAQRRLCCMWRSSCALYRRAKRAEETERADAQHEHRGLTFWHEDDGTVVLHALMVTMASWDSGDTRPEAGPAAGDWNPS